MSGKDIRDTVGLLLVVASMVFVGWEIRQSAAATRAATVLQLKENWVQYNMMRASTPELGVAFEVVLAEGYGNADTISRWQLGASIMATMQNWSNAYYQYRMDTLVDEQWLPILRDMETESANAYIWAIWEDWEHIFDDPFRSVMDSLRVANFEAAP